MPQASCQSVVAASRQASAAAAVQEIQPVLAGAGPAVIFAFHSPALDPGRVAPAMAEAFPEALVVGCTTMGEIGPLGLTRGGMSALALGAPARAAARLFDTSRPDTFSSAGALVPELAAELGVAPAELDPARHVLVTLTDGLSGTEEPLLAALAGSSHGLPLVGGSAGDDFQMSATFVHLDGRSVSGAAAVVLLAPGVPFETLHVHHYRPTDLRVVATRTEPARRLVHELDGWPARRALSELLGVGQDLLERDPSYPSASGLQFAAGGQGMFFLRSVMRVEGESLRMGGAVEEGEVLRVVKAGDVVASTRRGMDEAIGRLQGRAAAALLFSCGGRLFEAERDGLAQAMYEAMAPLPVAGFSTYGEQFGCFQVNHTLTGLLLGGA